MSRRHAMVGSYLLLSACGGTSTVTTDTGASTDTGTCPGVVELLDPGTICLTEEGLAGDLVVAGGCASILGAGCTASLDGDRIVVEGWAEVDPGCPGSGEVCVLSKAGIWADCGLPPLTDGTWTLVYGADEVDFDWPFVADACVGEASPVY